MTDEKMDKGISIILRSGVTIAALVVLAGGALYLVRHGAEIESYRVFQGTPPGLNSPPKIVAGLADFQARFIIQFGLLLLMATPIARVIACAAGFGLERDWKYVWISLVVLALLLVSLI